MHQNRVRGSYITVAHASVMATLRLGLRTLVARNQCFTGEEPFCTYGDTVNKLLVNKILLLKYRPHYLPWLGTGIRGCKQWSAFFLSKIMRNIILEGRLVRKHVSLGSSLQVSLALFFFVISLNNNKDMQQWFGRKTTSTNT